jgi:Bacterial Ig-like domain (group 3)/Right handed beta helix region
LNAPYQVSFISPRLLRPIRSATFLLLAVAVFVAPSHAQNTIHVPIDQPTIQAAINAANNGDTVLVAPGTYNENIDFMGKAITVTSGAKSFSDPAVATTIISGKGNGPVVVFQTNETSASILNGFTIQDGTTIAVYLPGTSPTVSNNIITKNMGCAVLVTGSAVGAVISGNDISQTTTSNAVANCGLSTIPFSGSPDPGAGINVTGDSNVQIVGNTIEGSTQGGVVALGSSGTATLLMMNNIIRNNGNPPAGFFIPEAVLVKNFGPVSLIQNLIYDNGSTNSFGGVYVLTDTNILKPGSAPNFKLTFVNNTIYGNLNKPNFVGGSQAQLVGNFVPFIVENNLFVGTNNIPAVVCNTNPSGGTPATVVYSHDDALNAGGDPPDACNTNATGSGNLSVDPQFLNPPADNFHTQPMSPVVATGDVQSPGIPNADLDGKARTVCGTIDMGVYEIRPHPPITLTGSPQTAPGQSNVTFTAALTGNCNMPTGVVTFLDGATILGTAPVDTSGVAIFDTSFLFVGSHPITATYPGDFNFEDSTSNVVTEVITGPPTKTVLNTVSPNPARPLQTITMTATVSSAFTTPAGNMNFMANGTVLATVPVAANGTALATVSTLRAGTYNITAVYGGSTQYAASTSNTIIETVLGTDTASTLTASPNPALPGQSITFTATVSALQSGIPPTGTVTFKDGATTLGAVAVGTNGVASFGSSTLLTGTHPITAIYGGSSDYNTSVSNTVNEVVTAIPTSIGLSISPNPATVGQTVTMIATAVSGPPNQSPTGTVTFSDQSGEIGAAPLVAGVAAFSTSTLTVGTHQVTATLNPTGSFAPSISATVSEVITAFDFALTASTTSLTIPGNDFQVLTVTVTPSGGFPRAVNLTCSEVPLYAECVFAQSTTNQLSKGPQTVKLTVSTSSVFRYGNQVGALAPISRTGKSASARLVGLMFPAIVFLGLTGKFSSRFDGRLRRLLLVMMVAAATMGLNGCSGRLPLGTPPGSYVLTVTATDSDPTTALSHSVDLKLQVTQ